VNQASTPQLVVSVVALGIFAIALVVAWWTKSESLNLLLGAASANATTVVAYWLGSSSGSRSKDATIQAQATMQFAARPTIGTPPR
jgi:hypothetical protein